MKTHEGQEAKSGWENPDDELRDELRSDLNAALEENRRLVEVLSDIVENAKAREGFQCGAPSLVTMYIKAEFIENARALLPRSPIASAKILNAASEEAVNNLRNQIESKRP